MVGGDNVYLIFLTTRKDELPEWEITWSYRRKNTQSTTDTILCRELEMSFHSPLFISSIYSATNVGYCSYPTTQRFVPTSLAQGMGNRAETTFETLM